MIIWATWVLTSQQPVGKPSSESSDWTLYTKRFAIQSFDLHRSLQTETMRKEMRTMHRQTDLNSAKLLYNNLLHYIISVMWLS